MHGNTKLKKEPPAVSRLLQCGSLVECELGLQSGLKSAIIRGFSNNVSRLFLSFLFYKLHLTHVFFKRI